VLLVAVSPVAMLPPSWTGASWYFERAAGKDAGLCLELLHVAEKFDCVLEGVIPAGGKLNDGVPCIVCLSLSAYPVSVVRGVSQCPDICRHAHTNATHLLTDRVPSAGQSLTYSLETKSRCKRQA